MNLRPKTKRRLTILLSSVMLCTGLGSALIAIQLHRHAMIRQGYRDAAMAAYDRGNYLAAMLGLRKYLSQNSSDAAAIYAYAISRSLVPEPDLKHLIKAKAIFSRYLELNPTDAVAQHKLLDIYRQIRFDTEASALAETLLHENPNDVEALRAKLQAMIDRSEYEPALPVSMRINELTPMDLEAQLTTYRLMAQLKRPADEMVSRAGAMLAAHPGDPRFELLRAIAADFEGDEKGVRNWLTLAAKQRPPDPAFTRELSQLFERVGMFEQARSLLAESLKRDNPDPEVLATLVEREWEAGDLQTALGRLSKLDAADLRTDGHLLGLKALILYSRGGTADRAQADAIVTGLARRDGENIAAAWTALLRSRFSSPPVDARKGVELCQAALHRDPANAVARYFLGLAYDDLGETELARQWWHASAKLATPWAAPHLSAARSLLNDGEIEQAYAEALAARSSSGDSLDQAAMLVLTQYARLGANPREGEIDSLLQQVREIQNQHPNEPQTLAIYVGLLARSGRTQEAMETGMGAMDSIALAPGTLLELAQMSDAQHLGLEPAIADQLGQIKPATPTAMFDRSLVLSMLGERVDGLRSLVATRDAAGGDATGWQLAVTKYREAIADGDVSNSWIALADANSKNLPVQLAVLKAPSAWTNRGLINRTIDRIKNLTGNECITWRLARARWDLANDDDPKTGAGSAAAMMADVVRMAPDMAEPLVLWATALEKLGDSDGAVARLRTAQSLDPANVDINLQLSDRLQLQGNDSEATQLLEQFSSRQTVSPAAELKIARALWSQGQAEAAVRLLDSAVARTAEPDRDLLLARIDRSQGKIEEADHLYSALLKSPAATDAVVRAAAWFNGWRGDTVDGLKLLDQLSDSRELALGEFDEAFANPEAAMGHYQASVTATPSDVTAWRALAGFELRRGKFDDVAATVEAGLKMAPGDHQLTAIGLRAKTLATILVSPYLETLRAALSVNPDDEAAVRTLAVMAQPPSDSEDQFLPRLREVADDYPRFIPAQLLMADNYLSAGHAKEAEEIAGRSMRAAPMESEPAQLMTSIWQKVNRWDLALTSAEQWQKRTLDRPEAADLAIGTAKLHLKDTGGAIAQISRYLEQAKGSPNQNMDVMHLYIISLAEGGRIDEARALLEPLLSQSPNWRVLWLELGVDTSKNADSWGKWAQKVVQQILTGSDEERLALARSWYVIGQRFNDADLLGKSHDLARRLAEGAVPQPRAWAILGDVALATHDLPGTEADFRKLMLIDPLDGAGPAGLSDALLRSNGDLKEAARWAEAAIALKPSESAYRCTLARIDVKRGDLEAARNAFETAIDLDAENVEAMIGLADAQLRDGRREEAAVMIDRADRVLEKETVDSASLHKRLDEVRAALRNSRQATSVTDVK